MFILPCYFVQPALLQPDDGESTPTGAFGGVFRSVSLGGGGGFCGGSRSGFLGGGSLTGGFLG